MVAFLLPAVLPLAAAIKLTYQQSLMMNSQSLLLLKRNQDPHSVSLCPSYSILAATGPWYVDISKRVGYNISQRLTFPNVARRPTLHQDTSADHCELKANNCIPLVSLGAIVDTGMSNVGIDFEFGVDGLETK